jgi:hypothetical protein
MSIALIGAGALGLAAIVQRRQELEKEQEKEQDRDRERFGGSNEALNRIGPEREDESAMDRALSVMVEAVSLGMNPAMLVTASTGYPFFLEVQRQVDELSEMVVDIQTAYPVVDAPMAMAIVDTAIELGTHPYWLANLINFESNRTFSPTVKNPYTGATGLIQFMPSTAADLLGMVPGRAGGEYTSGQRKSAISVFEHMSALKQMEYVRRYLSQFGDLGTQQRLYMAVFYPVAMRWSPYREFPDDVKAVNKADNPAQYISYANRHARLVSPRENMRIT